MWKVGLWLAIHVLNVEMLHSVMVSICYEHMKTGQENAHFT